MSLIPQLTDAGKGLLISALSGEKLTFTKVKIGNGSAPDEPKNGDYWYNTDSRILNTYKERWDPSARDIFVGAEVPSNAGENSLWYNPETQKLFYYGAGWKKSNENITCNTSAPEEPVNGNYWYDTANKELFIYGNRWNQLQSVNIYVNANEPDSPSKDDYWYNTQTSLLKKYNGSEWVSDAQRITIDSVSPDIPNVGDWWYDNTLHVFGGGWINSSKPFTYDSDQPISNFNGDWWYDVSSNELKEYDELFQEDNSDVFIYSNVPPARAYEGDLWYNSDTEVLSVYTKGWVEDSEKQFTYGRSEPENPNVDDWWYDSEKLQLFEYNGAQWSVNNTMITCSISEPETQDALTDLVNPLMSMDIKEMKRGKNYVSLSVEFDNSNVYSDFKWIETGVFAEDKDGNELLYAYCHVGDQYETIPSKAAGRMVSTLLTLIVTIGDAEQVTAVIGSGALYASKEEFEAHKRDYDNPHGVNKEQVGLGNVENVSPENMTVSFKESEELLDVNSGETMATFMGKVKKAIGNLIKHLKATNPHNISPKSIKAADAKHNHSTNDITEGILSVSRGGTGKGSIKELADALASYFKAPVFGVYTGDGASKREISLEFTPSAVILVDAYGRMTDDKLLTTNSINRGGLAVGTYGNRATDCTSSTHETSWSNGHTALLIGANCFYVGYSGNVKTNEKGATYRYIAYR